MKEKHLIVMSVDAMVFEDLEYLGTLPISASCCRRLADRAGAQHLPA